MQLTVRTLDKREYQIKAERGMMVPQLREAVAVSTGIDAANQVDPLFPSPATWPATAPTRISHRLIRAG